MKTVRFKRQRKAVQTPTEHVEALQSLTANMLAQTDKMVARHGLRHGNITL